MIVNLSHFVLFLFHFQVCLSSLPHPQPCLPYFLAIIDGELIRDLAHSRLTPCSDEYGYNCNYSNWDRWGRWVAFAVIVGVAFLLFFGFA